MIESVQNENSKDNLLVEFKILVVYVVIVTYLKVLFIGLFK